ncbi:MAG TPA: metal/formaldehyde-sensitive transcriptional repressor [Candidatus Aquilonibacter sp.]
MSHTIRNKAKLLARTRRIAGQVESVVRGLEEEVTCGDVLQRIAAARGALNGLMSEGLEDYLREHVLAARAFKPAERERVAADLTSLVRAYLK